MSALSNDDSMSVPVFPEILLPALKAALGLATLPEEPFPAALDWYRGRTVLVTGAGGSIGSELCRQLLRLRPARVILLERDEYSLFEIDRQLRRTAQNEATEWIPVLCDLRHAGRVEAVFRRHAPQVVLHTAACKHVPLLEENAAEAVSTNIGGTRVLLEICRRTAVKRCLLVSTDKAVQPVSLMGATKRVNEWMFSAAGDGYRWVRLGNVLGSRGSVVPLFREQIAEGGPVVLTDAGMTRYFIGLPAAARGILLAAVVEGTGNRFLLEMGPPVAILALAHTMIHLLTPDRPPQIRITGRRPGERRHECLLAPDEQVESTPWPELSALTTSGPPPSRLWDAIRELERLADRGDETAVREHLMHGLVHPASDAVEYAGR